MSSSSVSELGNNIWTENLGKEFDNIQTHHGGVSLINTIKEDSSKERQKLEFQ